MNIVIGLPSNSNMAADCSPIREVLELERRPDAPPNVMRSRLIDGAEFCTLRVEDIADFIRRGVFSFGVIGDDTACEADLDISPLPGSTRSLLDEIQDITQRAKSCPRSSSLESYPLFPKNRILRFENLCPSIYLTLFARPDIKAACPSPSQLFGAGTIATSYPKLAIKALQYSNLLPCPTYSDPGAQSFVPPSVSFFRGKIESLVATRYDKEIVGGFDVTRTGKTIEACGLERYGNVLESRPGLWQTARTDSRSQNQLEDIRGALQEKLRIFI